MSLAVEFKQFARPRVRVPEAIRQNGTIVGRLRGAGEIGAYAAAELLNRQGLLECHEHWRDVLVGRVAGGDIATQVAALLARAEHYVRLGSPTFAAYRNDLMQLMVSVGACVEHPASAR